ncbi:MAG: cytochrome b/b6 domain-containing protein [Nitrospirae bacterium]|nr:cytochrome b/b6 domain-containing protein [Nitrospirota bacterium]
MERAIDKVKVWDPFVRIFHWTLVSSFIIAYIVEDDPLSIHIVAGYTVLVLVLLRIFWGLIGSEHARFSDFVYRPRVVLNYLKDLVTFRAKRYIGHGPAGGSMIIALLIGLLLTSVSGLALYGAKEYAGPLAGAMSGLEGHWAEALEEVHEFFSIFTLTLVIIHVMGVVLSSIVHRENLVKAMFTGYKGGLINEDE